MPATKHASANDCDLESVIATSQLASRSSRRPNSEAETEILLKLHRELAADPKTFFPKLTEAALLLSKADSAGISILNTEINRFVWPAVAGPFNVYLWEGTPSDFGPCGTVLERNATQLMLHPERHFTYLAPIQPALEEVLLVPFYIEGKAVGTIWAVIHEPGKHFEGEDKRLLESLSAFAASAYSALSKAGLLEVILRKNLSERHNSTTPTPSSKKQSSPTALESARHQCLIYSGAPSVHLRDVAQTLLQKLKENHRCLYLNSPTMVAGMRWHLAALGIDLQKEAERGALFFSIEQDHLVDGKFDIDRMIESLSAGVQQALADSFVGLWAAGDMTWEFGAETNLEKLYEYEHRLDEFMSAHPALSGICMYHRDTLPVHAIQTALATHPKLYVSSTLSQINPHYSLASA